MADLIVQHIMSKHRIVPTWQREAQDMTLGRMGLPIRGEVEFEVRASDGLRVKTRLHEVPALLKFVQDHRVVSVYGDTKVVRLKFLLGRTLYVMGLQQHAELIEALRGKELEAIDHRRSIMAAIAAKRED